MAEWDRSICQNCSLRPGKMVEINGRDLVIYCEQCLSILRLNYSLVSADE